MARVNENYLKLPGSYLFSKIGKKVAAYSAANPDKKIIRLGIGDVTQPIAPSIIEATHKAVEEMGHAETFHGYAPDLGYEFLRSAIAKVVVLAGFLSVLGPSVIAAYPRRILNVHPALIPSFCGPGMYGLRPHEAALARGCKGEK